jgi:hypothetical protein
MSSFADASPTQALSFPDACAEMLLCARYGEDSDLLSLLSASFPGNGSVPVNHRDASSGNTALHLACANNHPAAVRLLLGRPGVEHLPNGAGNYPLHWAAANGLPEIARLLLGAFPDLDVLAQNEFGKSCLTEAFSANNAGESKENTELLRMLLEHKSAAEERIITGIKGMTKEEVRVPEDMREAAISTTHVFELKPDEPGSTLSVREQVSPPPRAGGGPSEGRAKRGLGPSEGLGSSEGLGEERRSGPAKVWAESVRSAAGGEKDQAERGTRAASRAGRRAKVCEARPCQRGSARPLLTPPAPAPPPPPRPPPPPPRYTSKPFETQLMVSERCTDAMLPQFTECTKGPNGEPGVVIVHVEACTHLHRALGVIREAGGSPSVALNPHTPAEMIENVLDMVDHVLVMTVNPGFGGQAYIPTMTDKIRKIRKWIVDGGHDVDIEVSASERERSSIPGWGFDDDI